ncbi:MAG: hypothetical protein AAFS03_00105 [Pseudomonadota bacterium]
MVLAVIVSLASVIWLLHWAVKNAPDHTKQFQDEQDDERSQRRRC